MMPGDSIRYYRVRCPDSLTLMSTTGRENRPEWTQPAPCWMADHGYHPVERITHEEYERLGGQDDGWDDVELDGNDDWDDDDPT